MALELNRRLLKAGTFKQEDDIFFLITSEISEAIAANAKNEARPELGTLAAQRRDLREAHLRVGGLEVYLFDSRVPVQVRNTVNWTRRP